MGEAHSQGPSGTSPWLWDRGPDLQAMVTWWPPTAPCHGVFSPPANKGRLYSKRDGHTESPMT